MDADAIASCSTQQTRTHNLPTADSIKVQVLAHELLRLHVEVDARKRRARMLRRLPPAEGSCARKKKQRAISYMSGIEPAFFNDYDKRVLLSSDGWINYR